MKQTNQSLEVLEPDVEEIPLEEKINTALVKANVTDAVIASLKEKYGNLKLSSIDNKQDYLEIKNARKIVRKVGIIAEEICEKGRESAIKEQRLWLTSQKDVLKRILEVQDPLDEEIKKFDDEEKRKELSLAKAREEGYINRQSALSRLGAIYNNGSFELNHISYEIELIKQADNDMWEDTILLKYRKEFEANETIKVEEENKRKIELDRLKKEQEQLAEDQRFFKEQQKLFAQQKEDLQKQKDGADRQQRLDKERKDVEERQKRQAVIDARLNELRALGLTHNHIYNTYSFEDISVDVAVEVYLMHDGAWVGLIERITPEIKQRKDAADQRKAEAQEKIKQDAIKKALEDAELKKQQDEQRKAEELAKSGDRSQWQGFLGALNSTTFPEMKSGLYRKKMAIAKEKLEEISNL